MTLLYTKIGKSSDAYGAIITPSRETLKPRQKSAGKQLPRILAASGSLAHNGLPTWNNSP